MSENEESGDRPYEPLRYSEGPIEIHLTHPNEMLLFGVPSTPARATHEALRLSFSNWLSSTDIDEFLLDICNATKLVVNVLANKEVDEFYHIIESGDLPQEDQARSFRAEMVFQLLAEGRAEASFFAPFWTAFLGGYAYASSLDAILIDPYQLRAYKADVPFWLHQCEAVPLSHQFLSVKGMLDEPSSRYSLRTSGMKRFSLPELCLENVPEPYGQDGAYLLRGVAQYVWNAIDLLVPDKGLLQLESEFDLSTSFCEANLTTIYGLKGTLIPVALCWDEEESASPALTVMPTSEFAHDDDWFSLVVQALRNQQLQIRQMSRS